MGLPGLGLAGGGTWVSVSREMVGFPAPSGDLESANQYAPSKKPVGELKSLRAPKFEQKPAPFVPIELLKFEQKPAKFVPIGLLCKHVTNHFVTRMSYADRMFFVYKKLAQLAVRGALPPRRSESPGLRSRQ